MPSFEEIGTYIGDTKPYWDELVLFIESNYKTKRQMDYSACTAQPGWNVKYKKNGKSLCTLYPMPDFFVALVVVGAKEELEVKLAMEAGVFTDYVKGLYQNTGTSSMGKWLMIEVKSKAVLNDLECLIKIRMHS